MSFLVREAGEENLWEERQGDLSTGGIFWQGETPPRAQRVDIRYRLPGVPSELRAQGEIIRIRQEGKGIGFHIRFVELDVLTELAIARYIDDQMAQEPARAG
jgi:hypothetical protein